MKDKKAFTLIELLAVIMILGLLITLIAPKIVNTLKESEKKTNMTSAQNLIKAAEYKIANNEIKGIKETTTIDYTNNTNTDYLDYSGAKPTVGKVQIRFNGSIAISVKFGDNCYTKSFISDEITTTPYNEQTCGDNANVFMNYTIPELAVTGDGLYEALGESGRYIYRGTNPNNYIYLKENGTNILYRIVSYESDGTIKVVRNDRITKADGTAGGIAWDDAFAPWNTGVAGIESRKNNDNSYCNYPGTEYGCNAWGNAANTFYNGKSFGNRFYYSYYVSASSTTLTSGASTGSAGSLVDESTLNKYLNNTWLNSVNILEYIDNHNFNVGVVYYTYRLPEGDKGLQKEKEEESLYTWTGKIGLMNITEYAEASLNPTCDIFKNEGYNPTYYYKDEGASMETIHTPLTGWPCKESNWTIKSEYDQWSLSPNAATRYNVWAIDAEGFFHDYSAYYPKSVRPAFYLKSSVRLSGLGTSERPYELVES